jgi:predicted ATPase
VELHGESEAYMPVLSALDRLARKSSGELLSTLARLAPSWLQHLPRLAAGHHEGQPAVAGHPTSADHRLREFCGALEELTQDRTLVLWLEDLHWCDSAILDLLAALAHREATGGRWVVGSGGMAVNTGC